MALLKQGCFLEIVYRIRMCDVVDAVFVEWSNNSSSGIVGPGERNGMCVCIKEYLGG